MSLSTVEDISGSVFVADGTGAASVPGSDNGGNPFVGSGLSLFLERLFASFPLSDVGLILAGIEGA